MQVYLPDDLYREVKERNLPASELLQAAVRAEVRRLDLLAATHRHLAERAGDGGEPSGAERERADVLGRRLSRRPGGR
jgi:hypothetical protein